LTLAVGFTALVNVLAATTLVWTEWLAGNVRWAASGGLAVVWLLSWIESRADWRRLLAELSAGESRAPEPEETADRWFREAQALYLAGDWVSAEQTLLKLLKQDARDAVARLMLATLWRHEGRLEAAAEQLDRLELLETAVPWKDEIAWERERIAAASVVEAETLELATTNEQPANQPTLTTPPNKKEVQTESTDRRLAA
jgi:tetratricopeptide (TPR) repeat protein